MFRTMSNSVKKCFGLVVLQYWKNFLMQVISFSCNIHYLHINCFNPNKKTDCWNKLWIKQCIRFISMISYLRVLHVISCTVDKIIKLADCRLFLLEWCAVLVYGEVSVINTAEKRWVKPHTWCNIYYKVHWQSNLTT